jgi:hypothetical protein
MLPILFCGHADKFPRFVFPAQAHWRQLKHGSNGFGNNEVAGFIPASAADHAAAHRLIKRRSIKDIHQVPGGDKQAV